MDADVPFRVVDPVRATYEIADLEGVIEQFVLMMARQLLDSLP